MKPLILLPIAFLVACAAPGDVPVSESESKPIQAIPEALLAEAWRTCRNPWSLRYDYLKAKAAEHPGYYQAVKDWLRSGVATKAYPNLHTRNDHYRCIEAALYFLAFTDSSKFASDLPFFAERWIDVTISAKFNGWADSRLIHVNKALRAAAQAARSGNLSATEIEGVREYLFESIQPGVWKSRSTAWRLDASAPEDPRSLSESAMNAFAIIPGEDTIARLDSLRDDQGLQEVYGDGFDRHLDRIILLAQAYADDQQ